MQPERAAGALVSGIFIYGGRETLKAPGPRTLAAADFLARARKTVPWLPGDDAALVRANAAAQVGAGVLLAAGIFTRPAAAVLAASLIPTTLAGHAPWTAADPEVRSAETIQLAKNAGILAALLLLAAGRRPQS